MMPSRTDQRSHSFVMAACVAALTAAVSLAAEPTLKSPDAALAAFSEADRNATIQSVYDRFAEYTRASGGEIELEVGGFESYDLLQFDELYWVDLFTLPRERVIETMDMEYRNFREAGNDVVSFDSKWAELDVTESDAAIYEFNKSYSLLKASDAIVQLAEWEPEALSDIVGVTTYQVFVTFEGIEHPYRAAFLWRRPALGKTIGKPGDLGDGIRFHVIDHTIPSVAHTYTETRPAVPAAELRNPSTVAPIVTTEPGEKTDTCFIRSRDELGTSFASPSFTEYHQTGAHSARFRPGALCTVAENCHAGCAPYAAYQGCNEAGTLTVPLFKHQKFIKYQAEADNGINRVTKCGAAFGCAVKHCLIGTCSGISWSVSGAKDTLKVSVGSGSSVLADLSLSGGVECDAPDLVPPPPPGGGGTVEGDEPDVEVVGSGSGSGGGSFGGGCSWHCWMINPTSEYCDLFCW